MELVFKFYNNKNINLSFCHIYMEYYNWFINNKKNIKTSVIDVSNLENIYPGSNDSGYFLTITNQNNGKFIIISMWDRNLDILNPSLGWDLDNCIEIITSCGVVGLNLYTPFTYLPYDKSFYNTIKTINTTYNTKQDLDLLFRGRLYYNRKDLHNISPQNIIDTTIPFSDYLNEIASRKISLSLNGAAEICHRDIEILSTGSVLFRPKLNVKFHNDLIPWEHYIPFEFDLNNSPKMQWDIINSTFNSVRDNDDLLKKISKNSLKWFYENGTIESSVDILKEIINIDKLK
jgi:hypothetical protein